MIDAVTSETQYAAHLLPIWHALNPTERGTFWVSGTATDAAAEAGIPFTVGRPKGKGPLTIVSSYSDIRRAIGREFILVEHGAGQVYENCPHPSYSGGEGREAVRLFLCPNQQIADRNLARYPNASAVVVGSPVLDKLSSSWRGGGAQRQVPLGSSTAADVDSQRPTVAISFHWDARLRDKDGRRVPEASWAFPHYSGALKSLRLALKDAGVHLIGHGHPRIWGPLRQAYHEAGIEAVKDFSEVVRRAQTYVIDNSSTGFEAIACGLGIVWLNSPRYRRGVTHGLRFWDATEGLPVVDEPDQLYDQTMLALTDDPEHRKRRAELASEVYAYLDGRSSERAAEAIRNL